MATLFYDRPRNIRFAAPLFSVCRFSLCIIACTSLFLLCGCAGMVTDRLMSGLNQAVINHPDPVTVSEASPSFLLLVDGMIRNDPENPALLRSAADLYSAYAELYVEDPERVRTLTDISLSYAFRAFQIDVTDEDAPRPDAMNFAAFETAVADADEDDLDTLYTLGVSWAGWIRSRAKDWNAVAFLPRVEVLMKRITAVDEAYRQGSAHLYLGALATLLPPALGGRPEAGRAHFERAILLSGGRNLMVKVLYARQYARLTFNRELHDRLLQEVIAADPRKEGYTLINKRAQAEARQLLDEADDFF